MKKLPRLTRRDRIEVRGVYGQPVFEFYQQAQAILQRKAPDRRLSEFFAEPQINPTRGEIAWFSHATGGVRSMSELSSTERAAMLSEVEVIREQIREVGGQFAAEGGSSAGTRAEIFKAMLSNTDLEQCLFLVGSQPVLCEWGCKPLGEEAGAKDLSFFGSSLRGGTDQNDDIPGETDSLSPGVELATPAHMPSRPESIVFPIPEVEKPASTGPAEAVSCREHQVRKKTDASGASPSPIASTPPGKWSQPPQTTADLPPSLGDRWHRPHPFNSRPALWSLLKRVIVALLLLFLILILMRACADVAVVAGAGNATQSEETQLRKDIAILRKQAGDILETCSVPR